MTPKLHRTAFALVALVLLAACQTSFVPAGTPDFRTGYWDGCVTGWAEAGRESVESFAGGDAELRESSADYGTGWEEGYAICYEDEWRAPEMLGGEPAAL